MRGRPKKASGETRKHLFQIRMTAEERAIVEQAAVAKSLDASAWARSLLLVAAKRAGARGVGKKTTGGGSPPAGPE